MAQNYSEERQVKTGKLSQFLLMIVPFLVGCKLTQVEGRGVIGTVPTGSVLYDEEGNERPNLNEAFTPPATNRPEQVDTP